MTYRNRRNFAVFTSGISLIGVAGGIWAVVVAYAESALKISNGTVGGVLALAVGVSVIVNLIAGTFIQNYGLKSVIRTGFLIWSVFLSIAALSPNKWLFCGMLVVSNIGLGLVDVSVNIAAASRFLNQSGRLLRYHGIYNLGAAFGCLLAGALIALRVNWRTPIILESTFCFLSIFLPGFVLQDQYRPDRIQLFDSLVKLKKDRLIGLSAVLTLTTMIEGSVGNWGILYLKNNMHFVIVASVVGFAVGQLLAATLRISSKDLIARFKPKHAVVVGAIVSAIGLLAEISTSSEIVSIVGLATAATSISVCWPLIMADGIKAAKHPNLSLSGITAGGYLGLILGPAIVGVTAEFSNLRTALFIIALVGFGGALLRAFVSPD